MTAEIEAAVVDSHREFWGRKPRHTLPIGSPCPNCDTRLQGPWCHACGQSAEDLHRSVTTLIGEVFADFTHFDGRVWRTIPNLLFKPGRLTRDYIEGHRAAQIPPLRLFLIVLLLVFTTGSVMQGQLVNFQTHPDKPGEKARTVRSLKDLTPAERVEAEKAMGRDIKIKIGGRENAVASGWVSSRLKHVLEDPERFYLVLESWSERFAFLMLPISALILSGLFVFQRRFYVFDHTIFSLHSLSFLGLLLSTAFLLSRVTGGLGAVLLLAAPVHLFVHMRGLYGTSVLGTLVRMGLLFWASLFAFVFLLLGLIWVGLNAMGA